MIPAPARFDFSQHLQSPTPSTLLDSARWRWISTFRPLQNQKTRHPRHARWIQTRSNTHAPAHREIMLTLQGTAIYWLEPTFIQRSPGTVILLNHHECRDVKGARWKRNFSCLWLQLHGRNRLTYYINHCDARGRYRHEPPIGITTGELVHLLNDAWDHCQNHPNDTPAWSLLRNTVSAQLLNILGSPAPASTDGMQQEIIRSVMDYIDAHPAENLSLHSLARLAGYSPHHFHRLFSAYSGRTPMDVIHAARFRLAQNLLRQGLTVEAVADAVGYSSTSYFSDFFKQYAGITPGAWRLNTLPP